MKNYARNYLASLIAVFGLAAITVSAQVKLNDLNFITVALEFQSQGGFSDNGTLRIYNRSVARKVATKDILNQLARDEFDETNYPNNFFPSDARLAINTTNGDVVVVNGNNELLVDVSNILTFTSGTNSVMSGKVNDTTSLAAPRLDGLAYVQLNFDDTFIPDGGDLNFVVSGLDSIQTGDTQPAGNGNYRETSSDSVKNAAGEGRSNGTPFVVTGTIQGNRNVRLTLN